MLGVQLLSSGADGLVKLWNVRSTECLNTFDGHEDKVRCSSHAFLSLFCVLTFLSLSS